MTFSILILSIFLSLLVFMGKLLDLVNALLVSLFQESSLHLRLEVQRIAGQSLGHKAENLVSFIEETGDPVVEPPEQVPPPMPPQG